MNHHNGYKNLILFPSKDKPVISDSYNFWALELLFLTGGIRFAYRVKKDLHQSGISGELHGDRLPASLTLKMLYRIEPLDEKGLTKETRDFKFIAR